MLCRKDVLRRGGAEASGECWSQGHSEVMVWS